MNDLTYLIIILVVINLVGRLLRGLQKSASQQKPKEGPDKSTEAKPAGILAVLEEKMKALEQLDKKSAPGEAPPSHAYAFETAEKGVPEVEIAEAEESFARETEKTREAAFEKKTRERTQQESFPYEMPQREYIKPERPVTPAPGPTTKEAASYRRDIAGMLQEADGLRTGILVSTILGPCRARETRYRFRGPR
jgi:hypothetical protein